MIPGLLTKIEILILNDMDKPEGWQVFSTAHPDLTQEQWMAVGKMICEDFGSGKVSPIVMEEREDGTVSAKTITDGPNTTQ